MKPSTFLRAAGALAVIAAFLHATRLSEPRRAHLVLGAPPEGPSVWAVDVGDAGAQKGEGKPMPLTPYPGQRRPPCADTQEDLQGGCWYRLAQRPPCGAEQYRSGDGCFLPVHVAPPPPVGGKR